jgi:hypothetical protein
VLDAVVAVSSWLPRYAPVRGPAVPGALLTLVMALPLAL